ncbi:MAG: ROK family protein [Chloroflexi bacterium]|nr:ROK family protein [Chloroflexota bacterium]
MKRDLALGVDIGGTKVAAVLVGESGAVLARARGPVAPENNVAGRESIFRVVDEVLASVPRARERLNGIGAGSPGGIDWRAGVIRGATNLAWRNLPLAASLRDRYGVAALLDNDVNAAAWGERCFGAGAMSSTELASVVGERSGSLPALAGQEKGAGLASPGQRVRQVEHLVFVTLGTGIGSGLIESGRIVRGKRSAGEIGHIPLLENGPRCKCGMAGCLEAVASGPALAAAAQHLAETGRAPRLLDLAGGQLGAIGAPHVVQAAQEGDPAARHLLDREGYYLALAVLIAGRMLDPEVVVIGGGLAEAGAPLFEALWANLARLRPHGPEPQTYAVPSPLGSDAGAIGAAALVLRPEPGFVAAGLIA